MGKSCVLKPCVRNPKGEIVESKLFQGLLSYLPSRSEAVKYYGLSKNEGFLASIENEITFDENGEMSLEDLIREAKIDIEQSKLIEKLQKEVGKEKLDFQEATRRVVQFNRNHPFKNTYMASLVEENGSYTVKVVENNEENLDHLKSTIANQELRNRLIYRLAEAGVDVSFIEDNNSRYSTSNAVKNANGLYQLINFYKYGTTPELAEEAGHFIVGAMSDNPLVERLMNLLTPEVQKEILGDEYDTKFLGRNPKKEVAGTLVGRVLASESDKDSALDKLSRRIINSAKRIFAKISGNQVLRDKVEAEQLAQQLAEEFNTGKLDNSAEKAIQENETFYSKELNKHVQTLRRITGTFAEMARDLKNLDYETSQMVDAWITRIESKTENVEELADAFAESVAATGIAEALKLIADFTQSEEFNNLVVKVEGLNKEEFLQSLPENAVKLRLYGRFLQCCRELVLEGTQAYNRNRDLYIEAADYSSGVPQNLNFYNNLLSVKNLLNNVQQYYDTERVLFAKVCELFYGSKYVNRATRMLWGNKKFETLNPEQFEIEETIDHLFADDGVVNSFLGTMANSNNMVAQMMDKILKQANFEAQKRTGEVYGKLKQWEDKWVKSRKITQRDLFETDEQGKLTGNTIDFVWSNPNTFSITSDPVILDWGKYEKDYEEQMKQWEQEFLNEHPEVANKASYYKDLQFAHWVKSRKNEWHKGKNGVPGHSTWSQSRQCYIPNLKYNGGEYINTRRSLSKDQTDALAEYYSIKRELDELTGHVMPRHRAPQMRGSFVNTVGNYHYEGKGGVVSLGKAIKHRVIEAFCQIPAEVDARSAGMYNTEKDAERPFFEYSERTRNIPLFGVYKLADTERLSTDLVHSTLAYAAMANNYAAMVNTANVLEVGMDYVENRQREGSYDTETSTSLFKYISGWKQRRSLGRMRNYLDKYLYGIGLPTVMVKGLCLSKLVPALSRAASLLYLAGNVPGGLVNWGTGTIEMYKEGFAGEFFDMSDVNWAQAVIVGSALGIAKDTITAEDSSKVNLFIRHFDLLNDNEKFYQTRYSRGQRILNNFKEFSLMAPYKMGEFVMQAVPYLAMARRKIIYDSTGMPISLWKAYQKADDGVRLELKETFFESIEDLKKYNMLEDLEKAFAPSNPYIDWDYVNNTKEWSDYLKSKNLGDRTDRNIIYKSIVRDRQELTFDETKESSFNDRAREVTNRMHGVYNKMDKTWAHRTLIGSMFLTMKGYAIGLIQRRFGGISNAFKSEDAQEHLGYSVALHGETEGTLTTMIKMAFNQRSWSDASLFFRALLWPVGKGFITAMEKRGYSTTQARNAKRNFGDIVAIIVLAILNALTRPKGDDEDDDELLQGHLYYLSMRLQMEQSAYNLPNHMLSEASSLLDAVPAGASMLRDVFTLANLIGGDILYNYDKDEKDPEVRKFFYQKQVPGKALKGDAKWKAKVINMTPYWRSFYWAEHPYNAASNYMYVRESKSK